MLNRCLRNKFMKSVLMPPSSHSKKNRNVSLYVTVLVEGVSLFELLSQTRGVDLLRSVRSVVV